MNHGVRLLGVPVRDTAGGTHELPPGQATHLAAVLALRGGWVARDELVALIWPDGDARRGRHNLAQLLYAMRRAPWGADLEAEHQRVRWTVPSDVMSFRGAAAEGDWSTAAEWYRGDLLEGVPQPASPELADWLHVEREDLRGTWRMALLRRAEELSHACEWLDSARHLRRLLASDGLLEDAVYGLIRAEALGGRRDAALRVYDDFRARLLDELGLEPLHTTAALAAAVRDGTYAPPSVDQGGSGVAGTSPVTGTAPELPAFEPPVDLTESPDVRPGPVRGLGADTTPFVGRALELAELHGLMRRGHSRLLTLHGPGGTGKTRLARQLARERAGHHEAGAAWVSLAAAASEADAVEAIARVLGLRLAPERHNGSGPNVGSDAGSLAEALGDRDVLVVLDQVEHLPEAAGLVQTVLDTCEAVRVVATSRVPLDLPDELVVGLRGLAVPPRDDADDAEAYDAVGLLLRAGRRTRPDLHPRGTERTALVTLARLLDGSPLGLELAAGWLRFLEPSEVLAEVRKDLDVLRAQSADIDPAHASLGAVFESSWSLLGEVEREALRRLAVFRGGCTRESAVAVAGVSLATLLALTNRSLLYRDSTTRFTMHSVVQHFAQGKLAERPDVAAEMADRHAEYFRALAQDTDRRLDTPDQASAIARLAEEDPNVTTALERLLDGGRGDQAYELVAALVRSWRWRGRAHEGLAWIERLRQTAPATEHSIAGVRVRLGEGRLLENTGRYDAADAAFGVALADAERLADPDLVTAAHLEQAIIAWRRGELDAARRILEQVCDGLRSLGRDALLAGALGNLGNVTRDAGDLESAHACFDEALEIVERIGRVWDIANIRNNKAIAFAYARDLESAAREFELAYELQRSIDNRSGMSQSLMNLGIVLMDSGDGARATELYAQALSLFEESGDADGLAHVNVNLGILAQNGGDFDTAHARFSSALQGRRAFGSRSLVAQSVLNFLDLAVARGAFERALVLNGALKKQLASATVPLPAPQRDAYHETMAKARASVPAHRAAELERRGAALADAEVFEFALGSRALP